MLLRFSFGLAKEADLIEKAVEKVLDDGWRTGDIAGTAADRAKLGDKLVGTKKMGDLVVAAIKAL
jgi:3-isopropylmalate dehydrogenase